ncbi:hypothetical protein Q0Z83_063680 [Actinoplanes sichuanensis]|uniref:SRPBCC family protein n=1 Tax=Actinoplanes sichuanensis TaxID=512349 RepID=A0ABW4A135_9ACTN|nr:SRPBCC family protein [Actinoplanes sichuanensis]BEL08177.1 hypothetical protein Q0Z83_063680 [Actinoplanes sichuanensis]
MKITNEFTVQIPVDQAWKVLTDLEGIAPCMPGAQLTGVEGDVYKGKVKVKVGPVISEFTGTAQFTAMDEAAYRAVIDAKGRDARSAGNAAAVVSASLTAESPTTTRVSVDTDLKISGKLAQFGSGMIKEVSSKLLTQFVTNLESKLATDAAAAATPTASAAPSVAATPAASTAPSVAVSTEPAAATPVSGASDGAVTIASDAAATTASDAGATTASDAAVATAPDSAVAIAPDSAVAPGESTPAVPENSDVTAPAIAPDPSAGEVDQSAGRLRTAEGTLEPVAPLRTPDADLAAVSPAPAAADAAAGSSAAPSAERTLQTAEPEAIDLLAVAGSSIYKRVIPVAIGAVVVAAVIVWFVARG